MTASCADLTAAGVVTAQTVRLARHLAWLFGEQREVVVMAAACTIAALAAGSVCFEVGRADRLGGDAAASIAWPDATDWAGALRDSPMVSLDPAARDRPLIMDGAFVYLTRYWAEQEAIADWLADRCRLPATPVDAAGLDRFLGAGPDEQRAAAALAAGAPFSVVAGGPGTGKTTIVGRILAVLAHGRTTPLRVILTAPTGRAAARLDQAVREELARLRATGLKCRSGTLHRVLGIKPWGAVDHDAADPLAADVVVVDEASMLSLHLMARLLDAVAPSSRLILAGDPDQLASVDAGAVLADIVANAGTVPVARLTSTHRFSGAIAELADAIRRGAAEEALAILDRGGDMIEWVDSDPSPAATLPEALAGLAADVTSQGLALVAAGQDGDPAAAIAALNSHRLLLAHRHGPTGVSHWTSVARQWISHAAGGAGPALWQVGLPVLVTRNDEMLGIYNGDSGVVIRVGGDLRLALDDPAGARLIAPDMVESWEPLYASTIHKAQGSQFDAVSLILPPPGTALLTRELFYTAVTRAKSRLRVVGGPEAVRTAIESPALRASGLASRVATRRGQWEDQGRTSP